MNEKQAKDRGLIFTGICESSTNTVEKLKNQIKEIKALGFKAYLIQSGRTEYGGGDKMIYAEPSYNNYERLNLAKRRLNCYDKEREEVMRKYQEELDKINEREKRDEETIARLEESLKKACKPIA